MDDTVFTSEAELIALLAPLTAGAPGALGLRDDCAQLSPRPGFDLVLKCDPVRAGVHFFADDPPEAIAWKALAVNVSDLAAKGAVPVGYLMALSFPEAPTRAWMAAFAHGLGEAQSAFGCHLMGGDTDRAPGPLSIGITVIGEVPAGRMVQRATAQVGDALYVSGTLGDAGLGLQLHREAREGRRDLRDRWGLTDYQTDYFAARYLRPQPRLELSLLVRQYASAAMDVSDGLVKDLERMCGASGVGAEIDSALIEWSPAMVIVMRQQPELFSRILSAGDDYEILAAVPTDRMAAFEATAQRGSTPVHRIGRIVDCAGVRVMRIDGTEIAFDRKGWDHF